MDAGYNAELLTSCELVTCYPQLASSTLLRSGPAIRKDAALELRAERGYLVGLSMGKLPRATRERSWGSESGVSRV